MIGEEGEDRREDGQGRDRGDDTGLERAGCASLARIDAWMKPASSCVQLDAMLEQRLRFEQRLAGRQQQVRRPVLGSQRSRCGRDAAADAQVLAILRDPIRDARPVPQQGLVRDGHDGAAVIGELGHEQPVLDERIDELATLAGGQIGPRRALAADRLVTVLFDAHERVQHLRQLGFDVVRQLLEYGLGALRERAFDTAEVAIRGQREHAVLRAALVQLLERELQQAAGFPGALQRHRAACRRGARCSPGPPRIAGPRAFVGRRIICPISLAFGGIRSYCPAPSFSAPSFGRLASRG